MESTEGISINGRLWRREPPRSLKTRATFIPARPLTINSDGDWTPYR